MPFAHQHGRTLHSDATQGSKVLYPRCGHLSDRLLAACKCEGSLNPIVSEPFYRASRAHDDRTHTEVDMRQPGELRSLTTRVDTQLLLAIVHWEGS
jgi:hypothetical protein